MGIPMGTDCAQLLANLFLGPEFDVYVHVYVLYLSQYKMEASFIEIYNEALRDLLSTSKKGEMKHEIRIDSKNQGKVYVTNITSVVISSEQQVCIC